MTCLAVTWWGHSSATIELDGVRVGIDPLLADHLGHLRRHAPSPLAAATQVDLILVSHLHADHLHVPSLRRFPQDTPVLAPPGSRALVGPQLTGTLQEVRPGDTLDVGPLRVDVLAAQHDGRRRPLTRRDSPALGFRVTGSCHSFWYPGDTGLMEEMTSVDPVDVALVPIGGWGPALGEQHLDPRRAAEALVRVGAADAVPVHYGTYWPIGLRRLSPSTHQRLFVTPPTRFAAEVTRRGIPTRIHLLHHNERIDLGVNE